MSTHAPQGRSAERGASAAESPTAALVAWLTTDSPLRFAARHLALAAVFLVPALAAAVLLRVELLTPALDLVRPRTFGALLSLHGSLLVYFVWLPLFPGVLGYAVLPRLVGANRLAHPVLMLVAWSLLLAGGIVAADGFLRGGTDAGWTFDAQFGGRFTSAGVLPLALGVAAAALAVALMGANLVATVVRGRGATVAPGALPTLVALLCGGATAVVAGAGLAAGAALVALDQLGGVSLFDPALGGDPLRWKALRGLVASAAQSTMLLTALGVVASVVLERARGHARASAHRGLTACLVVLAVAGLVAWPSTEASPVRGPLAEQLHFLLYAVAASATMAALVRITAMLRRGAARVDTALVYALGFLATTAVAVCTGAMLTAPGLGSLLGSTTFATAHLHLVAMALGMALLAGVHDAWPQLAGRRCPDGVGIGAAVIVLIGTGLTFVPQLVLGVAGASFRANTYPPEFQVLQVLSTGGMTVLLAGVVLALTNLAGAGRRTAVHAAAVPRADHA